MVPAAGPDRGPAWAAPSPALAHPPAFSALLLFLSPQQQQQQQQPQQPQQQNAQQEAQWLKRAEARKREQLTYQLAAIAATSGITATAAFATYYR